MTEFPGAWIHLQLREDFYTTFEVAPVPMPIRTGLLFEVSEEERPLSTELLTSELVAYLEEHPEEYERYRAAVAELAMSVGTAAGKAGDHAKAVLWLERSVNARGDDARVLVNYAVALVRCGRPGEAFAVCQRTRSLRLPPDVGLALISLEAECRRAMDGKGGPDPVS